MTWLRKGHLIAACCLWLVAAADNGSSARAETVRDNPVAALSLAQLSATRERPLFSPSRRAPSRPVLAIVSPPPILPPVPPPIIVLYGTIIDADEAIAIVFHSSTGQTRHVHIGDVIDGWKVDGIDERKLVLSLENRTAVFSMFADKTPKGALASRQQ
jgi:hypothetical protein